jgi:hypothetical protein
LLVEFEDIFAVPTGLPPSRDYDHHISLVPGHIPVNSRPYRYSPLHKTEIEKQVSELLTSGLIVPSMSPFASPVLLVQKKDGSWRFCVDYRKLNDMTIKNRFPMPLVDEILDELAGTQYFTSLDMTAGYHQIRMKEEDEYMTAFKTHQGHYQFRVMPFGLTNAPATFQCAMNAILQPFLRKFVMVFLDDILVYSSYMAEHLGHLRLVFTKLREHQFFLKKKKCSFAQPELQYLGHVISREGVATDSSKTAAMLAWPIPQNITELRGFLGLTGYYRKFVKGYGVLAKPLTKLLQKQNKFSWGEEAQQAFEALKQAMTTTPVLALPRFDIPFIVETDACDIGMGAVLMQEGRPIAFLSKALGEKNKHLSIYEKEFLALILAVDKWRPYLQRAPFIIRTDHQSLTFLGEQQLHSELQKKAMAKMMGLQFQIVYKKGVENAVADALSRVSYLMALSQVSEVQPLWVQEVLNSYETDMEAQELKTQLLIQSPNEQGYSLHQGIIRRNGVIWIGDNSALRTKLITALHDSAVGGHSGVHATYHRVKKMFWWKGLKNDVTLFVAQCQVCQQAKSERVHPPGLLQPLPIPTGAWEDVSMDFVEGLPKSEGFDTILVVVDRFSKYAHFISLKHPYTAQGVAQVFLDTVVKLHGAPKTIVSDRDKVFTSSFWTHLFQLMRVKLLFSTAYHPQTDGQTERVNQCLEQYLRCAVHDHPHKWRQWLALAEFWYNTTYHTALDCSPFKILYGYTPPVMAVPWLREEGDRDVTTWLQARQVASELLRERLAQAQNRMKQMADRGRTPREFQVGEFVLLKLQPYAQKTVVNRPYPKLSFKFFGPFKIVARIGAVAYRLELPENAQIHPVFHVSQLKAFHPKHTPVFAELPKVADLSGPGIWPEKIVDRRLVRRGNHAVPQVMIKWSGLPVSSATWEDFYVVKNRFPNALAWGQARSVGGKM